MNRWLPILRLPVFAAWLTIAAAPALASNLPSVFYFGTASPASHAAHFTPQPIFSHPLSAQTIAGQSVTCAQAGNAAEASQLLPANILVSIGMVESGRYDALNHHVTPWPWTVNIDGAGHYFDSKQEAIAFTRLAQSSGANDIDVGCFQVSLKFHPDAFTGLDAAFDPAANASYAAGYLLRLKNQTGSWNTAIADYHSAVPDLGLPYQRRVLAFWHGIGEVPSAIGSIAIAAPDPVVIMQAPAARLVRVITMTSSDAAAPPPGLPRVITP